jgi:hypothetical protein
LRKEHRLRVFKHGVLRKVFGPERDEVAGDWRGLKSKEVYGLYSSPHIISSDNHKELDWRGMLHVWETGEVHTGFWCGHLRERPRRRWENNITNGFQEVGWGAMDWIDLAQDRDRWRALVNAAMNLRVL